MADVLSENIRNVAIIGHNNTGKTTLADAILFEANVSKRFGKVDEGTSVFDYSPEEIERKITISSSLAQFEYNGKKINLIDTPGYMDFIGEPISILRAVDSVIVVISSIEGIVFNTIKLLNEATKDKLSKIIFINKLDKENSHYDEALASIKDVVKKGVMPLTVPIREGNVLKGVLNIFENKCYLVKGDKVETSEVPDNLKSTYENYRLQMVEAIAETKDELMEKYFAQGALSEDEINNGLKNGIMNGAITPVFAGSAIGNVGLHAVLDFIAREVPSPADRDNVKVMHLSDKSEIICKADPKEPLRAFVFKTQTEPHVGELNFVRVFSGEINYGAEVYNVNKDFSEKIGLINNLVGKEKKEVKKVTAGDIAVLVKLKKTAVGDTLCSEKDKYKFDAIEFPRPLLDIAIKAKTKADEDKLSGSLHKLMEEDPTLRISVDPELKQTIISAMGETQVNIFIANLKNKYQVDVEFEKPKIPYRETIKKKAQAQGKYKKQTGGRGQYGDCWLEIEPLPLSGKEDFIFDNKIVGGSIPGKYIPSVEKGVRDLLTKGILAGYPLIKIRTAVYDGSYHTVDSSDIAFQIAGSMAFKNASADASLILLEPILKVKIYSPDAYMGDIMSDLNSRRGKILGMDEESGLKVINANVPQAEMHKYINDLKSMTQGSGVFESAFDHYEEVPRELSQKIIEAAKKEKIEE